MMNPRDKMTNSLHNALSQYGVTHTVSLHAHTHLPKRAMVRALWDHISLGTILRAGAVVKEPVMCRTVSSSMRHSHATSCPSRAKIGHAKPQ